MLIRTWLTTLRAQGHELKLAGGLALASVIIVFAIVLWSLFFKPDGIKQVPSVSYNTKVETVALPKLHNMTSEPVRAKPAKAKQDSPTIVAKKKKVASSQAPASHAKKSMGKITNITLGQGNYYLQVGAFKQVKLARLMLEKMKHQYHYVKIRKKGDKHAVWIGPVITLNDAKQLQTYVQRKNNIKGFITIEK